MVLVPPMHTVATLLIALGVFGVGSALFNPSMSGLVSATAAPQERGAVLGAYQGAASLGRVLGPFTASLVAKFGQLSWPFIVGGVISVVGAMLIRERRSE